MRNEKALAGCGGFVLGCNLAFISIGSVLELPQGEQSPHNAVF
jgi:hypothetical protein